MTTSLTTEQTARPTRPLIALFGLLLVALVARFAFLAWEPPFDPGTGLRYDDLRAVAGLYWPANLYVGGPAFLVTWLGTAAFLAVLGRGHLLARIGSVLVAAGGIVFSLVIVAEALPYAYAVDPGLVDEPTGRALVDTINRASAGLFPAIVGTQVVIGLGVALGLIGILVVRGTPRWFPIVGLVYLVAFFALPIDQLGSGAVLVSEIVQTAVLAGIGWFALQKAWASDRRGPHSGAATRRANVPG